MVTPSLRISYSEQHVAKPGVRHGDILPEQGLKELEGVQTAYVNLNEEKVLVKYDKTRVTMDDLEQAIVKLGYQADDVPADVEAYNNLPGCCKLPEDR